jgi:sigma-E factor negative regulatory protein RseA
MNTESREHISSLMDGENSRETGRFLVRRLGADEELCATWARYHLVRDCLRHQEGGLASETLALRVRRAIENESLPTAARKRALGWLKPAAGMAVAASVAMFAIVAVGPGTLSTQPGLNALSGSAEAPSFVSPQGLTPAPVSQAASLLGGSESDSRMNAYLLRHYQAAGAAGGKGFVTYVPIVIRPVAAQVEPVDLESNAGSGSDGDELTPSQ